MTRVERGKKVQSEFCNPAFADNLSAAVNEDQLQTAERTEIYKHGVVREYHEGGKDL